MAEPSRVHANCGLHDYWLRLVLKVHGNGSRFEVPGSGCGSERSRFDVTTKQLKRNGYVCCVSDCETSGTGDWINFVCLVCFVHLVCSVYLVRLVYLVYLVYLVCLVSLHNYSGVQAEGYSLSRKARIKPFKTFSVSTALGSSRDESFNSRLKTKRLQPIYLSSYIRL